MERSNVTLFDNAVDYVLPFIEQNQTADEIAERHNISRATVYRAINEVKERGAIKKSIDFVKFIDEERDLSLEQKLGNNYGIDARVFRVPESLVGERFDCDRDIVLQAFLGKASAQTLSSIIRRGDILGIGGGRAVQSLANELGKGNKTTVGKRVRLARSLAGGIRYDFSEMYPNSSADYNAASIISTIKGGKVDMVGSFSFDKTPEKILSDGINVAVFEPNTVFPQTNHELFANPYVGEYVPEVLGFADLINQVEDLSEFVSHPVVEILNRFQVQMNDHLRDSDPRIDDLGRQADYLNQFSVGASWEELRDNVDVKLAIAGGPHKYDAVRVALNEGLVTNLVTDQVLAGMLVDAA